MRSCAKQFDTTYIVKQALSNNAFERTGILTR